MNETLLREAFTDLWKSEGVLIAVNHHHPDAILPDYLKERENIVIDLWKSEGVLIAVKHHHPDAILPDYLKERENIVIDYDPFAIVPITDLVADETGIRATLSFDRIPCKTFVPWDAILGMVSRLSQNQTQNSAPKPKRHLALVK